MATNITRRRISYGFSEPLIQAGIDPIISQRDPTTADRAPLGTEWVNTATSEAFFLTSIEDNIATWVPVNSGTNANSFVTDSGTATPVAGVVSLLGGTGIATSAVGNVVTIASAALTPPILTITGDSGGAISPDIDGNITIETGYTSGPLAQGTASFSGSGNTISLTFTDPNANTGIGLNALKSIAVNSAGNTAVGTNAGISISGSGSHSFFGNGSGVSLIGAAPGAGGGNQGFGDSTLYQLIDGVNNIAIGDTAGGNLINDESSNIYLNNEGVVGDNFTLRIGSGTGSSAGTQELSNVYIAGIKGVNVGSVASVVSISDDHLGFTTLTAGSGISVTPGANTITIASTASSTSSIGSVLAIGSGSAYLDFGQVGSPLFTAPYLGVSSVTQSDAQFITPVPGTLSKLFIHVAANTSTTDVSLTVNVNNVATAITVNITALTTGTFSDITHTAAVVAGDLIQFEASGSTVGPVSGAISILLS